MPDPQQDAPWFRNRLLLSAIGLILSTAVLGAGLLAYLREQTMREGMRLTDAFAAVIDEQVSRTLQTIDLRLERLSDTLANIDLTDGNGETAKARVQMALRSTLDAMPFIDSVLLVDPDGKPRQTSDPTLQAAELSNRDFVRVYKTRPRTGFFIGTPMEGRHGEWLLPIARPVAVTPEGVIDVMVANIRAAYFGRLWASLAIEADASVVLLRSDGKMLLRSPIDGSAMGESFSSSPLLLQHLPSSPLGGYRIVSTIDGKDRYMAYRTLGQDPNLVVIVGRTIKAILAPWYGLVLLLAGVWFAASVSLLLLSVRLARQSARRKRAEGVNAALQQRLGIASESTGLVLWEWDLASDTWDVTPAFYSTLGYPPQAGPVTRAQWQAYVHPDEQAVARTHLAHVQVQADEKHDQLLRMRHADGSYRWMRTTGQVSARDAQGRPTRRMGIRIDVTDRIQAEQERQQMVDRISDALVTISASWRITHVNARAGVLLGYHPSELIGQDVWTMFPDSGGFGFREAYERCMATQLPELLEEHFAPAKVWYESHIYPSPEGLSVYFRDITERKLGELALRDAKEQAENLINGANVMVVGLNPQGQITIFNKMAQELTGYTLADLAGRDCFEILVPRERYPQVHAEFERLAAGGLPQPFENTILTATGAERVISWQNSILRDGANITGTLSFGQDVSLRRKAERELAESKEQFETLANNSLQGIALIRKGHFMYVNPAYCAITGHNAAELYRLPVLQAQQWIHPDDRAVSLDRHQPAVAGEATPHVNNFRLLTGQGQWRWIQVATRSISLGGKPALLSMLLDVHDRHLAEEALRTSEERFRSAFDSSGIGMGLNALDGRWLQVNTSLCNIVGYTAEELCQRSFMEITYPDDLALDLSRMDDLLAGRVAHFTLEKRYVRRDGRPVWVNLTVALVRNADARPLYTVAQVENIDLRKTLERELRESQSYLKATLDALPDLMFEVDLEGIYHFSHSPRSDLLLRPGPELIGKHIEDVMSADAARMVMASLHDALGRGYSMGQQIRLDLAHGPEWFELSITRKDTPANQSPRFIVLSRQISDRVRALEALHSSEELMRQMAESVSQLFLLLDLQAQRYLYVSPAVERVLGFKAEALYANPNVWHGLVHPQDLPAVRDELRRGAKSGAMDIEFRLMEKHPADPKFPIVPSGDLSNPGLGTTTTAEGSVRWIHVRAYPVPDAQGQPYRSSGVIEDITPRKELEIREVQEQNMLQYLASNRPLAEVLEKFVLSYETQLPGMMGSILLLDPDGQHLRHGAAPHLPAAYCTAIDGGVIGPAAGSCGTAAFTGESVMTSDVRTDPRWVDYRDLAAQFDLLACWSVPIKGMLGQVLGTFAFYFDHVRVPQAAERLSVEHGANLASQAIERHLAVQALQRSEARYRNVVEWSPVGIMVVQEGCIVYCNPAACKIHGAAKTQDLLGTPVAERIHPVDRDLVAQLDLQVIDRNESTELVEIRSLRLDGSVVDLQTRGAPTVFDGAPAVQVVMLDISARKQAEAALRASQKQLRLLSAKVLSAQETERRRVAHELHDELGQSLTAIKINLQSQSLIDGEAPSEPYIENIRIVEHALQHVRQMALALRPSMLDDLGLVSALRWLTEQVSQRQKLHMQLKVSDAVGRLPPDTETAVFRIVQEALTNIERHANADTVQISADIEAGDAFVLRIVDNGSGFEVGTIQAQASAGASMGVLGMDERATLIGGTLSITSTPGIGTTVTLRCPLTTEHSAESVAQPRA